MYYAKSGILNTFNNIYMKITTDEYLYVWFKGYKNLYNYNNKAIWGKMNRLRDDHTKWSESDGERWTPLKIWHKWTYIWQRNSFMDIENRLVASKAESTGGGME